MALSNFYLFCLMWTLFLCIFIVYPFCCQQIFMVLSKFYSFVYIWILLCVRVQSTHYLSEHIYSAYTHRIHILLRMFFWDGKPFSVFYEFGEVSCTITDGTSFCIYNLNSTFFTSDFCILCHRVEKSFSSLSNYS